MKMEEVGLSLVTWNKHALLRERRKVYCSRPENVSHVGCTSIEMADVTGFRIMFNVYHTIIAALVSTLCSV